MRLWANVRALRWNPFRWNRRARVIAATASAAAIALAVSLLLVFTGDLPPVKPVQPPPRQGQLFSPFTGEPVTTLGPVLAVKIDNDARWSRPAPDGGTAFTTTSGQPMTFARGPVWIVLAASR